MNDAQLDPSGGQWLPDGTGVVPSGQVGGDDQVGESFSVRFSRADRPGALITRSAYPVTAVAGCEGQFLVRVMTEWLVCSDPADPGGTELWSEQVDHDKPDSYETAAEAEKAARETANRLLSDAGALTWDGLAPWERGKN